jgi:hypothetical protein
MEGADANCLSRRGQSKLENFSCIPKTLDEDPKSFKGETVVQIESVLKGITKGSNSYGCV